MYTSANALCSEFVCISNFDKRRYRNETQVVTSTQKHRVTSKTSTKTVCKTETVSIKDFSALDKGEDKAHLNRRAALVSLGTLAGFLSSSIIESPVAAAIASEEPPSVTVALAKLTETYKEPVSKFVFNHPSGWVTAVKRTPSDKEDSQTLAVVGNFKDLDTVSVSREALSSRPELQRAVDSLDPEQVMAALTAAQAKNSGTLKFLVTSAQEFRRSADEPPSVMFEYMIEICRGRKIEGSGGEIFCVGQKTDDPVQTVMRHATVIATVRNGYIYSCAGSCAEDRWETAAATLREVVQSFRFH